MVRHLTRAADAARLRHAPRWAASGVTTADLTAHLPASDGYVRYRYEQTPHAIRIEAAATAETIDLRVLLPEGKTARAITVNGGTVEFDVTQVEQSRYACARLTGVDVFVIEVGLA